MSQQIFLLGPLAKRTASPADSLNSKTALAHPSQILHESDHLEAAAQLLLNQAYCELNAALALQDA